MILQRLKPGFRCQGIRPELVFGKTIVDTWLGERFGVITAPDVWTSADDGSHGESSLHYAGAALDLRSHNWDTSDLAKATWAESVNEALGPDFDFIYESTVWLYDGKKHMGRISPHRDAKRLRTEHFHLEYQPKKANR